MKDTFFTDKQKTQSGYGSGSQQDKRAPQYGTGFAKTSTNASAPGSMRASPLGINRQPSADPRSGANFGADQSAGSAGSGFVNLSQMLDLNAQAGQASANAMARQVGKAGAAQRTQLNDMSGQFQKQADAQSAKANAVMSYDENGNPNYAGSSVGVQGAIDQAQQGYKGPASLGDIGGYNDLQKALLGTAGTATNLAKGGQGIAAEVQKQSNLSPTQSAAEAFYMGVNNPNLKQVGKDYSSLGDELDKANSNAVTAADMARRQNSADIDRLKGYKGQMDSYWAGVDDQNARTTALNKANAAHTEDEKWTDKTDHTNRKEDPEVKGVSDENWNEMHGMPGQLAHAGVDYQRWLAAGQPQDMQAWLDWEAAHPEGK